MKKNIKIYVHYYKKIRIKILLFKKKRFHAKQKQIVALKHWKITIRKKIKKQTIGVLLLSLFSVLSYAQFDAQKTQYMFNTAGYNPAAIGEQELMKVFGSQRIQWVGITNAPMTTDVWLNAPFKIGKTHHSAGVQFINDQFGLFRNQQVNVMYAYKQPLGEGVLSIGASFGLANIVFRGDSAYLPKESGGYYQSNDKVIPTKKESDIGFDLGMGIYYSHKLFDVGLSILHITKPTIELGETSKIYIAPLYLLSGGYSFLLPNPRFCIKPTMLIKTDFVSWQLDVGIMLEYDTKYWGGLAYRIQDAVSIIGGIKVLNGLMIGYSYDIPTSKLIQSSYGSHEIFLSYEFKLDLEKKENKYKSIRIL